jgi:hypothetical protein
MDSRASAKFEVRYVRKQTVEPGRWVHSARKQEYVMNTPRQPNARPGIAQLTDWISGRTLNPLRLSDAALKRFSKPLAASNVEHVGRRGLA